MAGMMCPKCGKRTFHRSLTGRECSNCGYKMIVPANAGKGGKGTRCSNCGKMQVFNGKCRGCGAYYQD